MTHKALRLVPVVLALALAVPAVMAQAPIQVTGPGRVTVRANGVPLGDLLQQLSVMVTMDRLKIAPEALSTPVTIELEDAAVDVAMLEVLKASSVDFVLSGTRLLAGGAGAAPAFLGGRREVRSVVIGAAPVVPRHEDPADNTPERQAEILAAGIMSIGAGGEAAATGMPVSDETADQFGFLVGVEAVKFRVVEDSAVIETPGFIPYKLRPEVKARRMAIDPAKIP